MTSLKLFNFENQSIRVIDKDNAPWFILVDVCKILEIGNSSDVKKRLKEDGVDSIEVIDAIGRPQLTTVINQRNLDRCVLQSRKEEAIKFQDWIIDEVLPSIRKTGSYSMPQNMLQASEVLAKEVLKLVELTKEKDKKLEEQGKTIEYQDKTIQEICTEQNSYGLREVVRRLKVQEKEPKDKLKTINWIMYLKDEHDNPKLTYTSYAKENGYASQMMRLNEKQQEYYSQFRITNKGLEYLMKRRNDFFSKELCAGQR